MIEPLDENAKTLQSLLDKLLDGTITEPEHRELQRHLLNDPQSQDAYFRFLDLDSDLRASPPQAWTAGTTALGRPARRQNYRRLAIPVGAAALVASMLLAIVLTPRRASHTASDGNPGDAILVQSAGGQFFRDTMPTVGKALKSKHTYALTKGLIELRFRGGAEVILEAPAVLEVESGERLVIRQGVCSVHAPPGAEGFRVATPQAEVVDLGTRFSVAVAESGDTEVQVVEGAAEIHRHLAMQDGALLLKERQASRAAGGQVLPIRFSGEQYRRDLPDRVIRYRGAHTDGKPDGRLESVVVQRGGVPVEYPVDQLIGVEVTYFRGGRSSQHLSVPVSEATDTRRQRLDLLESDRLLHTGILNMGGSETPLNQDPVLTAADVSDTTPGMAIRFRSPVINGVGPDVVFFELQSVVNPPDGDAFHVSPIRFGPGLQSLTVRRYDITLHSEQAISIPSFDLFQSATSAGSLEELLDGTYTKRKSTIPFFAVAVGIDLSDLGYAGGAEVRELFFQDASDDVEHQVDPVFIGGLPVRSSELQ